MPQLCHPNLLTGIFVKPFLPLIPATKQIITLLFCHKPSTNIESQNIIIDAIFAGLIALGTRFCCSIECNRVVLLDTDFKMLWIIVSHVPNILHDFSIVAWNFMKTK